MAHAGGRPTKYNPKFHPKMAKLAAANGLTDEEIAKELEIDGATFYRWKTKFQEFCEAVTFAKKYPNEAVKAALYRRAVGYTERIKKQVSVSLGNGMGSELQEAYVDVHVPGDTTAQKYWLNNRDSENWRERVEQVHSGEMTINQLTPEERRARIEELSAKRK